MPKKDDTILFLQTKMRNLKSAKTDLACDLLKIFKKRLKRFKDIADSEQIEQVKRHIEELEEYALKPCDENKLYIIYDIEQILLISYNLSNDEVSKLAEICEQAEEFDIAPKYLCSLYIFKKGRITFQTDLYPNELSLIIKQFHSRNLLADQNIMDIDMNSFFNF